MEDFNEGDQVQLKSGGPIMTIQELGDFTPDGPENGAQCVWFDKTGPMERIFSVAVLKKYEGN